MIYFEGNGASDPLFLQVKEEPNSCYAPYLKVAKSAKNNGQRVVDGQRAMQVQTDPFLGWTEMDGRSYLVRQLNDHKGSIEITDLAGSGLAAYAEVCVRPLPFRSYRQRRRRLYALDLGADVRQ